MYKSIKIDNYYWKKLRHLLVFLKGNINNKLIIGSTGMKNLWTWFDAAYTVN